MAASALAEALTICVDVEGVSSETERAQKLLLFFDRDDRLLEASASEEP